MWPDHSSGNPDKPGAAVKQRYNRRYSHTLAANTRNFKIEIQKNIFWKYMLKRAKNIQNLSKKYTVAVISIKPEPDIKAG